MVKVLITAGGTSEKIDDVRRITNFATGRLGMKIVEAFAASGHECHITYICSESAVRPEPDSALDIRVADDVNSVMKAVEKACAENDFDVIVHSMAISDYRVKAVRDSLFSAHDIRENKIPSDKEELIIVLEKAPKIIALLRGLAPNAVIVGFKLLSCASKEDLLRAGHVLLMKNDCDYVLANDMMAVKDDGHEGFLIARDGTYEHTYGKDGIATLIVESTIKLLSG